MLVGFVPQINRLAVSESINNNEIDRSEINSSALVCLARQADDVRSQGHLAAKAKVAGNQSNFETFISAVFF